ncbi:MAG TPA: hypothetical protein VIY30_14290, partial [Burkholderiaceae bacterium]
MTDLLPRLLTGAGERPMTDLESHIDVHGPLPLPGGSTSERLIELVEAAGLRGHGGASFPAAKKMRAVASRRGRPIVVANGCEGEPASRKDRLLLSELPHLVLDGAAVAARAVGARQAIVGLPGDDEQGISTVQRAVRARKRAALRGDPS